MLLLVLDILEIEVTIAKTRQMENFLNQTNEVYSLVARVYIDPTSFFP